MRATADMAGTLRPGAVLDFVPRRRASALPVRAALEILGYGLFGLFIFFICFTFLRPSPYDFMSIPTMALWLALGVRLYRGSVVFLTFLVLYNLGLLISLIPWFNEEDPVAWTFQSFYLMLTSIFFVMFFSDDARRRAEWALQAYLLSCVFASIVGIISYVTQGDLFYVMDGRAAGVFADPNVLGSFLVMGVLFTLRKLLTGEARFPVVSLALTLLMMVAIFLSFSRGSWGALIVGAALMTAMVYKTSAARIRRRIVIIGTAAFVLASATFAGLLASSNIAETFSDRATITKDYDEGETGRFGNQRRSLPMLLDLPNGFGPLRFRLTFGLEPHNSYIGGFANGGWLGGFAFLGLVMTTTFVGFRLCLKSSPYQAHAQIVFTALFMFFLQAFQIDIDHWRHVFLQLGMVWGLECARMRWAESRSSATRQAPRGDRAWQPAG